MEKSEVIKEIGLRCAIAREKSGLLQKDIARMLHTTQQNISQFEMGEHNSMYLLAGYIAICKDMTPFFEFILQIDKEIKK